ncbi:MAG TPA: hypothetical protein VM182_13695 [Terriglobia bacterium]|nr:hypothetical protein [Terriglobia bacterium]
MDQKMKVVVIIAVICAALAGFFAYRLSVVTDENSRLQEQVATLQQESSKLKSQLDELSAAQATLQRDYESVEAENEELKAKHGRPAKAASMR